MKVARFPFVFAFSVLLGYTIYKDIIIQNFLQSHFNTTLVIPKQSTELDCNNLY